MTLQEIAERFLDWCEPPRRAATTVRAYRSRLKPVLAILGDKQLQDITPLELQAAVDAAGRDKAPDTRRLTIVVVERLQKWAVDYDLLDKPILTRMEKPRGRRRERIPTPEETQAILDNAPREFALIYRALRISGARPNELCRATIGHVNADRCIELREHKTAGKTGVPRIIVVGNKLQAVIDESLASREQTPETHLFVRPNGKPWNTNTLGQTYRRIRDRLGLSKDLCIYLARHECATKLSEHQDIAEVADLLGHKNISTTMRYRHPRTEKMRENQDLFEE